VCAGLHIMMRWSILFLVLLSQPAMRQASRADVLLAGGYIEAPELTRFVSTFQSPDALALCPNTLQPQRVKTKITGCELERCPDEGCAPGQCTSTRSGWRQIEVYADCHAQAFLRGVAGLTPGAIRSATPDAERNLAVGHIEGFRFRFADREFLVRTTLRRQATGRPTARLEILRDGQPYSLLREQDAEDMACAVNWMGDLNGDGLPDVVLGCTYDTYQRFSGLFLSRKGTAGAYEFIAQRVAGGGV
jgi:hypothetical protein